MPESRVDRREGLRQLDRMGWDTCVLAGDEFGVAIAARIAAARPEIVEGIALGHARLSNRTTGDRAPVNREVLSAFQGLARTDYRSWVRAFGQMSAGAAMGTGYGEEFVERYMESVRPEAPVAYIEAAFADQDPWDDVLRSLGVPMLMVEHSGCLLFTREGFEEAVAAFPDAETASMVAKPSASEEFALSVRGLCSRL